MRSPVFASRCFARARDRALRRFSAAALLGLALTAATSLDGSRALAQSATTPPPAARSASTKTAPQAAKSKGKQASALDELGALLASQDSDELRMGIESAAASRKPGSAALLAARVREGLPADLMGPAIDALAALGDPKAGEVLAELSAHRRPAVRAHALLALSILRTPNAEGLLIRGLSDQDEGVRKSAADGLGQIGSKQALSPLFRALERNVDGAAAALGKLAEASTVPRITAYFGRMSFMLLAPLLDALLTRRGFAEEAKLSLIESIVKHGSSDARAYLEGLLPQLPPDTPTRVRKAVIDAQLRMPK